MEDRKSTRLNSSHTEIYTLSLHDALPIFTPMKRSRKMSGVHHSPMTSIVRAREHTTRESRDDGRSEEHTFELQSHRDLHSFPTRRSSDLHADEEVAQDERRPPLADDVHRPGKGAHHAREPGRW